MLDKSKALEGGSMILAEAQLSSVNETLQSKAPSHKHGSYMTPLHISKQSSVTKNEVQPWCNGTVYGQCSADLCEEFGDSA